MTRQEAKDLIRSAIIANGFKVEPEESERAMPRVKRSDQDYISIQIFEDTDTEKTDWAAMHIFVNIKVRASVCQMGGDPTTEDLMRASDEIARAAELKTALEGIGFDFYLDEKEGETK